MGESAWEFWRYDLLSQITQDGWNLKTLCFFSIVVVNTEENKCL